MDHPDPIAHVRPRAFGGQLSALASIGVRTTTARDAASPPRADAVGLTFDDGYLSAAVACEAVLARGWAATIFVVPGWLDTGRRDLIDWLELRRLAALGIEIAAHGYDHSSLCRRPLDGVASELRRARDSLEQRLGTAVSGLAYPFGLAPRIARDAAALAGYAYACTSIPGANVPGGDPFRLRRNEVLGTDDVRTLQGKLAGADDWYAPIREFEHRLRCGA